MFGGEHKGEAALRLLRQPSLGLLGKVGGMIVEDDLDRGCGRVGGVEPFEELDDSRERCLFSTLA